MQPTTWTQKYSSFPSNEKLEVNDQNDSDASFEVMEAIPKYLGVFKKSLY